MRGDHDGRQGPPAVLAEGSKLQDGRQEEIMVGDTDWRFPGTPGSTIWFQGDKKGDKWRLRTLIKLELELNSN